MYVCSHFVTCGNVFLHPVSNEVQSLYHLKESSECQSGPKAGMALVEHADANKHTLLNTRKLPVYSTCRLSQQTQTLSLLVVVQGQCTAGCAADDSGTEGRFSVP
jgi:hypothetical protein